MSRLLKGQLTQNQSNPHLLTYTLRYVAMQTAYVIRTSHHQYFFVSSVERGFSDRSIVLHRVSVMLTNTKIMISSKQNVCTDY